jgi:drug/metabolite transporter (DMT)-like permease
MVYLGVFLTAIAFSRMPAARAASFLYVIPVMAYVIAWLWLGEIPTLLSVVGGVVTLAGVLLVNVRGRRR